MTVGQRIKRLREQKAWTQIYLAEKMFINNSVLSRIESGNRDVDDYLIVRFSDIFGVTSDYLLGRTEDPNSTQSGYKEIAAAEAENELTEEESEYLKRSLFLFREIKQKFNVKANKKPDKKD